MTLLSFRNITVGLWIGGLGAAAPAVAVEYTTQALVDQRVYYDSNIMLFPDTEEPTLRDTQDKFASAYELVPAFQLTARGQRWQGGVETRLRFSRLSESGLDSDDQFLDLNWQTSGERMSWNVDASIDRTSTRALVDELDDVVLNASRIVRRSVDAGWSMLLTEKDRLRIGANRAETDYDLVSRLSPIPGRPPRYSDYEVYGFDIGWQRQLSEQDDLTVTLYSSQFDSGDRPASLSSTDILTESDTLGLQLGFNRRFNESLSGSVSIGARQVDTATTQVECVEFLLFFCTRQDFVSRSSDSSGFTARTGLSYAAELWSVSASVSRSLVPNGSIGDLLETDTADVRFIRRLAPELTFELVASASQAETLGDTMYERNRLKIEPLVRWRFAEQWTLSGSLRYRLRDLSTAVSDDDADSTAIIFQVRYAHPRAKFSR